MLWVGLTGGIGAGKSAVSRHLQGLGAAVVDADLLAREVVEPGTAGLAAVVEAFGEQVLGPDGALDRPALGARVFGDDDARRRLNGILHPLIGYRTAELAAEAEAAGAPVLVHDVPLLVENGLAPAYHLVLVVQAPLDVRLDRLVRLRGMAEDDARARMAAQATDAQRADVADVVLDNGGELPALHEQLEALWRSRLLPYAENVAERRPAVRGPITLVAPRAEWADHARRLTARIRFVGGPRVVGVEHVGSTAVPGLVAKDVVDLQVLCPSWEDVEALGPVLADAGFPRREDVESDPVRPELDSDPEQYRKRIHLSADPGRAANVHVRVAGTSAARSSVAFRDALRADGALRDRYADVKRQLAARHGDDVDAYAEAKTPFVVEVLRRPGDSQL